MYMFDYKQKEREQIIKWKKEHDKTCRFANGNAGAIGGRTTYSFTPNSLGTVKIIECACGDKLDVTDYNW